MEQLYSFSQTGNDETWKQIQAGINASPYNFTAVLQQDGTSTVLRIDIDPGSGFASGYAFTSFVAPVQTNNDFKFALHHQGFLGEIGKFFGMQDVVVGYEEFDDKVIVKTNDEMQIKDLVKDDKIRQAIKELRHFSFGIHGKPTDDEGMRLELLIEEGITEVATLQKLYALFIRVHKAVNYSTAI